MDAGQYKSEYDLPLESYSIKEQNLNKIISEYRLTQNNFNPDKRSPPNRFMNKLEIRMKYYYSNINNIKNVSL